MSFVFDDCMSSVYRLSNGFWVAAEHLALFVAHLVHLEPIVVDEVA